MMIVEESRYRFIFGSTWEVLFPHFDTDEDYRGRCLKIQGTKAVDTIARRGQSIYFFEMKNYHDSWLEHSKRIGSDSSTLSSFTYMLAQELAQKLRDTLSSHVFFSRAAHPFALGSSLIDPSIRLKYVLFLEGNIYSQYGRLDLLNIINAEVSRSIKTLLFWSHIDVFLVNVESYAEALNDLTIVPVSGGTHEPLFTDASKPFVSSPVPASNSSGRTTTTHWRRRRHRHSHEHS